MAKRILGPRGSRRRSRFLFVPALFTAALALIFFVGSAQAVHEFAFQLDGDTTSTAYSPPGTATPAFDWNDIFNVTDTASTEMVSVNATNVGSGKTFDAASFMRDFETDATCPTTSAIGLNSTSLNFCTADDTTYATGSKDTLGIGNGGWQCNHDNNVNSKIDITNAYVLQYTNTNGHKIFYFGVERNVSNGTNDVGVWFLQSGASCTAPSGHLNFTGQHQDGDTLVVAEQTSGGGVSTAKAFRWAASTDSTSPFFGDGGCIDSNDNFDPSVVVNGTRGCNNLPIASGGDCKQAGAGDSICATTNAKCAVPRRGPAPPCTLPWNDDVTTNWLTANSTSVGHTIVPPDFFEGGIDITAAFAGHPGTAPSCFNTSVPDTRSSASPTATLFDFTINQIGGCAGALSTQENAASSREIGANGTISSGTDTATLQITGTPVWGGTLTWYLCGPGVTTCDTSGYIVTGPQNVSSTDGGTGADVAKTYTSGTVPLTSAGVGAAGEYCWHAQFVPNTDTQNAGIDTQDDNGANECFFVTPKTPTLTTAAVEHPVGLLSPTMCSSLADLNGDCASSSDPTPDNGAVFYGSTSIIGGKLDCNTWASQSQPVNAGTVGDGSIGADDDCTLLGYDGTTNGVTINVVNGVFGWPDGTALPAIFPKPTTPTDNSILNARFAWSTRDGRVDANGDTTIDGNDCSVNIVNTYDILGSVCQGYTIPQGNGLVDLNDDGKITTADTCANGCFLGHNVSSGFVVAGSVPLGSTLADMASLTGTANEPGNNGPGGDTGLYKSINATNGAPADSTINWTLYAPGGTPAGCSITKTTSPASVTVSGDGTYGPTSYTTLTSSDAVGTYTFVATYAATGMTNTTAATPTSCPDTSGTEKITVIGSVSSSSKQRWLPNDRVVLTSTPGTTLTGSLSITLYSGTFSGTAGNCTAGTATAVNGQSYTFTPSGDASPNVYQTSNTDPATGTHTTFYVGSNVDGSAGGAAGSYFWLIHYHDNNLTSPTDRCETSTVSPITDG